MAKNGAFFDIRHGTTVPYFATSKYHASILEKKMKSSSKGLHFKAFFLYNALAES